MIRLLPGDCRDVLATLPAESVHCVVTSPPYYGLRDYGTAQWDGGDAACDHTPGIVPIAASDPGIRCSTLEGGKRTTTAQAEARSYRDTCGKCGATRIDRQIGLEATPDAYLATMVQVFREVRRVLRRDGACWVNMGSSYSSGKGANVTDQLNRLLEGGSVFFANTGPNGIAGHGVGITLQHERAPEGELSGLLSPERDTIEYRHQDLGKIADLLTYPGAIRAGSGVLGMVIDAPHAKMSADEVNYSPIVRAQCDAQSEPILAVLRPAGARAREDDEAALAVHQPDEPCIRGNVRWHSAWHTFAREAVRKGLEDINLVDQAIALGDRPQTVAGLLCDFRVAKASEKQVTLTSIHGGLTLAVSDVGQLWFVLRCGSIVPYHKLYADASRFANALLPKQDLGMPWRLARALQEDGWILRSPIIWHKPNPMPESCTDRPTSAHEHVFLLTRSGASTFWTHRDHEGSRTLPAPDYRWVHVKTGEERDTAPAGWDEDEPMRKLWRRVNLWRGHDYFYDATAIAEEQTGHATGPNGDKSGKPAVKGSPDRNDDGGTVGARADGTRSCRNVWTIATQAFPSAHFATFPAVLAERCIRAGTSERGCCAQCGAPWVRQTETSFVKLADRRPTRKAVQDGANMNDINSHNVMGYNDVTTTGWSPSCSHGGDPVPATVLDPFAGAGTTLLVADRLQRDAVGVELNPAYTEMAMARCRADAPLLWSGEPDGPDVAEPLPKAQTTPRHDGNRWNENNGRGFLPRSSLPVPEPPEEQRQQDMWRDLAAD